MAPKKKSKSGKGVRGSSGIIDGVSISEMSREQLESFVSRIQLELEREREERNFFQLERDKIRTFWEITRQQLEENRAQLQNKDKELEESEEKHNKEMKAFQQKVKHLMYEQQTQLSEKKLENMIILRNAEADFSEQELHLLNDKQELKTQIIEEEAAHLCQIRTQLMESNETIAKIRLDYENNCRALEHKYHRSLEQFREELDFKNEIEVSEIEERKNKHIKKLVESHDKIYDDTIRFYTEITAKNLALISVLKEKLLKMKNEKYQMRHEIQNYKKQSEKLITPLKIARQRVHELQQKISIYERDQRRVEISEKQLNVSRAKFESLQYSYDTLTLSYEQLENEKKEMQRKLIAEFLDFQQKAVYQNVIFEQKISELKKVVESKEAQIIDLIIGNSENNFTLNPKSMQDVLNAKNEKISTLTAELSTLMKTHNDIIQNYKAVIKSDSAYTE